ncbi:hypothetical protein [Pseudoalteromonas phenolica]|nr:hypothetical protein [Pseudoalteromonas phenolica]
MNINCQVQYSVVAPQLNESFMNQLQNAVNTNTVLSLVKQGY